MSHIYISVKGVIDDHNTSLGSIDVERMGFDTQSICIIDKNTIGDFMYKNKQISSDMSENHEKFYNDIHNKGIHISFGCNNYDNYNKYMETRGFPGVIGDVIIFAETIDEENLEIGIDTNISIMLAEAILEGRGKRFIDCLIHTSRKKENSRIKLNRYVKETTKYNTYTEKVLNRILEKGELVHAPDDSSDIICCEITCSRCGSCKPTGEEFITCECGRAIYCDESCQFKGWRSHSKHVHTGKMSSK